MRASLPKGFASKAEERYAQHLELMKRAGQIRSWDYEPLKIILGRGAAYTPDFVIVNSSDEVEIHEYKGHWREAARVRIKAAANRLWWAKFFAVTGGRHPYTYELIEPQAGPESLEVP